MSIAPEDDVAFPRLSDDLISVLDAVGERRVLHKGDVVHRAGEVAPEFLVVLSGRLAMYHDYGGPAHRRLASVPERSFSSELNLVNGQPAYLTTLATRDGDAIAITLEQLRLAVGRNQELGDLIFGAFVTRRARLIGEGAGLRLVGSPLSPDSRRLREFLVRNRIPHEFVDLEADEQAERLLRDLDMGPSDTPLVLGTERILRNPSNVELAAALNLRLSQPSSEIWDVIVVGAGPAGLGAAVYAASEGLSAMLVDSVAIGGQASTSARIENYLGFPAGISGSELAERAALQARRFGAASAVPVSACGMGFEDGYHVVELEDGGCLRGRTVVIATGAQYRRLAVERLAEFEGAGVYYAATEMEAQACVGAPTVVVGGANSAGQAAVFLAGRGNQVELVVRRPDLDATMSRYLIDQVQAHANITLHPGTEIMGLHGSERLEAVTVTGGRRIEARSLFVFIGASPCTGWVSDVLMSDEHGFLVTGSDLKLTHLDPTGSGQDRPPLPLETSRPGVFAVGDVRSGSIKRVAAAVGEGSTAVRMVHQYLAMLSAT